MSLEIKNVTKYYGKKKALSNVTLTFDNGIYGLLGPNGAGKTTLISIMVTALSQTDGEVLYNGRDIRDKSSGYLETLGFLPQNPKFYKNYTAEEFLKYMAALKGIGGKLDDKISELFSFVNLSDERKNKIGSFSGGMLQRIGIAQALLNEPKILILDEPTAGLDPKERIRFRNLISEISKDRTVILATHIVPDIEYIANNVILLRSGEVCKNDTPTALMNEIDGKVWSLTVSQNDIEKLIRKHKISNILRVGNEYILRIVSDEMPHNKATQITPNLEDVFLYHIGEVTV